MKDWLVTQQGYWLDKNTLNAPAFIVRVYTPPRIWLALVV